MSNNKGIVYLIQPAELVGTNRYKVGCSDSPTLQHVNSYKKGSRFIHICECSDAFNLEKKIIDAFSSKFILIAGKEYFEGDENLMYDTFLEVVNLARKDISKELKYLANIWKKTGSNDIKYITDGKIDLKKQYWDLVSIVLKEDCSKINIYGDEKLETVWINTASIWKGVEYIPCCNYNTDTDDE